MSLQLPMMYLRITYTKSCADLFLLVIPQNKPPIQ